jgi:hypothetical protein
VVSDVAVVPLNGEGQVFAGEELILGDLAMIALPVVGQERPSFQTNFVD